MSRRALAALSLAAVASFAIAAEAKPRLVLVISIDQFRADYLERFAPWYLPAGTSSQPGGFQYLTKGGAYYVDAHHAHIPTATGPGHAAILSGSVPALNGIIGNNWFDRASGKEMYCVDDPSVKTVGGTSKPMSPRNLKTTTVGDELKMATNSAAKVVGVAFKDRAAILMAGHAADTVIWFGGDGNMVTSTFYAPSGNLPGWVSAFNGQGLSAKDAGKTWKPLLADNEYRFTRTVPFAKEKNPKPVFQHDLGKTADKAFYGGWTASPYGQEFIFKAVEAAVVGEKLGQDDVPDVLAVNLSTNDYIGHAYGPNSPEVMDISVRTDRLLSGLFRFLAKTVPGGLDAVEIVITADHGVLPIVEEMNNPYRIGTQRVNESSVGKAIDAALGAKYGEGKYYTYGDEDNVYLDHALLESKKIDLAEAQREAAKAVAGVSGIYDAYATADVRAGMLPVTPWAKQIYLSYNPKFSGDVFVLLAAGNYFGGGTGTGHGSAWQYDSHVPILMRGPGVKKGVFTRRVVVPDLAPTLSVLLGVEPPSGNVGNVLGEAVGSR